MFHKKILYLCPGISMSRSDAFHAFLCQELKKEVKRTQMSGKCQVVIAEITRETNNFAAS